MGDWDSDDDDTWRRGATNGHTTTQTSEWSSQPSWRTRQDDDGQRRSGGFRGRGSRGMGRGGRGRGRRQNFGDGDGLGRENGGDFNSPVRNGFSSDRKVLQITVLNSDVGKIIGRGGEMIRSIQSESGAHVKIQKDLASFIETPIDIIGDEVAQSKAKELIEELMTPNTSIGNYSSRTSESSSSGPAPKINWAAMTAAKEEYEAIRWSDLPDVRKDFYFEADHIKKMSHEEAESIRKDKHNISVSNLTDEHQDRAIPNPILEFEDAFESYSEILDTIYNAGFSSPTPIQSQSWPVLLSGLDMIGIAQTGTGKTLAFLLPAFIHIRGQELQACDGAGPNCLVLSPTRELAQQIKQEVEKFHYKGIKSVCIYGGGNRREQIDTVKQGIEIVIGTPGRLNDLIMNNFLSVRNVSYLVLDEADRMLDMGFEPEIKKILLDIRPDRQTVMTSATWPPGVQRMADQYLKHPVMVNVGSFDLQACHTVTQYIEFIDPADKKERVLEFIDDMGPDDKLLLFVGKKITADDISSDFVLREVDIGVQCIHGDREQSDREQALHDFRTGEARLLIATDVASRGLDIKDITHVINFDFPRHMEEYVHRIGRTGRAGRSGTALTFMTRQDWMHAKQLIDILAEAQQEVPDELVEMAERHDRHKERVAKERAEGGGRGGGRGCHKCGQTGHMQRECPQNSAWGFTDRDRERYR